jgi:ATP-dependent Clp protease, protease subunit
MRKLIIFFVLYVFKFSSANAEVITYDHGDDIKKIATAKVYFTAMVRQRSVAELGNVLNQLTTKKYPSLKVINLIINSPGGGAFDGLLAYTIVKGSSVPIKAINGGLTASAATFIYCAAAERQSVPGSLFLLHAAASDPMGRKPDEIMRTLTTLDHIHKFGKDVYGNCTSLSDDQIEQIFQTEYFAKYLNDVQASEIKLSNQTVQTIPQPDISVFIIDKEASN